MRRSRRIAVWSIIGGAVAYGLSCLLTDDLMIRQVAATGGTVAAILVKLMRFGRFGGIVLYGLPLTVGAYAAYHYGWLDLDRVTISMLYCISGASLIVGALLGMSEELVRKDR